MSGEVAQLKHEVRFSSGSILNNRHTKTHVQGSQLQVVAAGAIAGLVSRYVLDTLHANLVY